MNKTYSPDRGHIIKIDFDPQAGSEQRGMRPAIVLSPYEYNRKTGLAIVCPITNQSKGYPFEVTIPNNLSVTGVILSDHIKSLDWRSRSASFVCKAPHRITNDVIAKLKTLF